MSKLPKLLALVVLFASCCVGPGCDSSPGTQGGKKADAPDLPAPKSTEEKAARQFFLQEWDLRFGKCGDTYYATFLNDGFMCDGKEYILALRTSPEAWEVQPMALTDADRANKIKWYCELTVRVEISSLYDKAEGQWSQYRNGTGAFWSLTPYAGGVDIPIIFQVVEYENGSHNLFYSNQYAGTITVGANDHLLKFFASTKPVTDCGTLPERR